MLDARTQTQTPADRPTPAAGSRLPNAAAWLRTLAALEAEFKTILEPDRPTREQPMGQRRA
jgi:hypothetical protein